MHWGFSGPNRWVITSSWAIIVLLAQRAFICLLLIASACGVLYWSRRISNSGPSAASERQFRRRTVLLILTAEYFTIVPPILGLLQAPVLAMKLWSVVRIVTIAAFVISLMRAGQGGARLAESGQGPIGDRTADTRWIGGLLYFNPTDPAVLVERRMGIGLDDAFWQSLVLVHAVGSRCHCHHRTANDTRRIGFGSRRPVAAEQSRCASPEQVSQSRERRVSPSISLVPMFDRSRGRCSIALSESRRSVVLFNYWSGRKKCNPLPTLSQKPFLVSF